MYAVGRSDRARITCNTRIALEIGVETHCDAAQQEPALAGDTNALRLRFDQAVIGQGAEPGEFGGEIRIEDEAVPRAKCVFVDFAIAHQGANQVAAHQIIGVQKQAPYDRHAARVERGIVARQVARILAVAVADPADRADAEPDDDDAHTRLAGT